jgi:hypothetical protein
MKMIWPAGELAGWLAIMQNKVHYYHVCVCMTIDALTMAPAAAACNASSGTLFASGPFFPERDAI